MRAIYLYPALCYFEATALSIGRGTEFAFQVVGHPQLKNRSFSFTPNSLIGAKNPPLKDVKCYGYDLRKEPTDAQIWENGVDLSYVVQCYRELNLENKFFTPTFEKLIGVDYVRQMIIEGKEASEIRKMWTADVQKFKTQRKPYLIYEE